MTESRSGAAADLSALDGLGSITDITYNEAGRLASTVSGGRVLTQYIYDAFGRRLAKQGSVTKGALFQYDHDGLLLEEADAQGRVRVDYVYLDGRPIATLKDRHKRCDHHPRQ